jgi:hypothetical protein
MKKLISVISFVLVLVMLSSGATVFGAEAKFKDFDWYVGEFGWNGFPDGLFIITYSNLYHVSNLSHDLQGEGTLS